MALLDLDVNLDPALDLAAPIDAAVAANANVALPIDAAVSANVLSPGADRRGGPAGLGDHPEARRRGDRRPRTRRPTVDQGGGDAPSAEAGTISADQTTLRGLTRRYIGEPGSYPRRARGRGGRGCPTARRCPRSTPTPRAARRRAARRPAALLDLDVDRRRSTADAAAPVDAAVAANANIAAPIDAAVSANIASPDATSMAVADQDSAIVQNLDGQANATANQTASVEQGGDGQAEAGARPACRRRRWARQPAQPRTRPAMISPGGPTTIAGGTRRQDMLHSALPAIARSAARHPRFGAASAAAPSSRGGAIDEESAAAEDRPGHPRPQTAENAFDAHAVARCQQRPLAHDRNRCASPSAKGNAPPWAVADRLPGRARPAIRQRRAPTGRRPSMPAAQSAASRSRRRGRTPATSTQAPAERLADGPARSSPTIRRNPAGALREDRTLAMWPSWPLGGAEVQEAESPPGPRTSLSPRGAVVGRRHRPRMLRR